MVFKILRWFAAGVLVSVILVKTPVLNSAKNICTVTEKETVWLAEGHPHYRIHTDTCGMYVIENSITWMRFDSVKIYDGIVPNTRYEISSGGYRVPSLNMYPNILKLTPVK